MKEALVLYGATDFSSSQFSADLLWRTKFIVPDPVYFCEINKKGFLFASLLEVERAQKEACVEQVFFLETYIERGRECGDHPLVVFLKEQGVEKISVPSTLPVAIGSALQKSFQVSIEGESVYPARVFKTPEEIQEIAAAQKALEHALQKALDIISAAHISGDGGTLVSDMAGMRVVTAEDIRRAIDTELFHKGYFALGTIVACGTQAADPHQRGSGPLIARQPIVIDIFPRSLQSGYFSDQTRTVFKGEPSQEYQKMYEAVLAAQERAIADVGPSVDASVIMRGAQTLFEERGYPTQVTKRPVHGFIHGLGHGVGLEIHEAPRVGNTATLLQPGMVITIEPGLYYGSAFGEIPAGGIRLEDILVVTDTGYINLTTFPKSLRGAIFY